MCYHDRSTTPSTPRLIKNMGHDLEGARALARLLNTPGEALARHREWHVVSTGGGQYQVAAVPMVELLEKIQRRTTPLSDDHQQFLLAVMWVVQHSDSGLSPNKTMANYIFRLPSKSDVQSTLPLREALKKTPQAWQRVGRSRRRSPVAPAKKG